ncbi:MAG TPA: DNA internalization-related competence protein ComEC/Rec2 [Candidatus Brocadiaceae bacterium]|nr:DNA internalization-related competence protein ComEC/Rec2 [Candidatus Brocadiaceae bacterium]
MQRPIVIITILFVSGVYLGHVTAILLSVILGICLLLWIACLASMGFQRLRGFLPVCVSLLLVSVAAAYYDCRTDSIPANHLEWLLTARRSLCRIKGVIISPPIMLDDAIVVKRLSRFASGRYSGKPGFKTSFLIRAEAVETMSGWREVSGTVKVNFYPSDVEVFNKDAVLSLLHQLVYGQRVELLGQVFLPTPPRNPGEYDYKGYLQKQMPSVRCLMTVSHADNVTPCGVSRQNPAYRSIYTLGNALNNMIYLHTFSNSAPMISSMMLGNRVDLPGETIDNFMKTGIIHFIAISGFNVAIVVFTIWLPLRLLRVNQTLSIGAVFVVVFLYAFLTGLNPPVLRACIMVAAFLCSFLVRRQWDITSGLFTAVFFILVRNPADLFNVGFQLSVVATFGIVYGSSRIEGRLFRVALFVEALQVKAERGRFFFLKKYLRKSFCVSLAAWLATMPITAYYFHLFTPGICITNLIVFPLFWIITVCGIVLLTLGTLCPPLAAASAWLASSADMVLESLVSFHAAIPYSYFYVTGPSPAEVVVYYLFMVSLLFCGYLSLGVVRLTIFGLLSANVFLFSNVLKCPGNSLQVTCLHVGHGSAIFIQFPNGKNMLYDAGSWQNHDGGRYVVSPFLWERKVKVVDLLILSHEDDDHWNGLPALAGRFSIKSVYSQQHLFESKKGQEILSLLNKKRIPVAAVSAGELVSGFDPAVVKILHPLPWYPGVTTSNDNSCVIKIEYLGHSILLCADIQEQGIAALTANSNELKADVLQIPHHGSFANNLGVLLDAVQPLYGFINTSEGVVSHKTIDRLQSRHILVLQTHQEGAITFTVDGSGIRYTTF